MSSRLPSSEKLRLIFRVKSGEPIARLCREVGISRTIFYRWLKTYQSTGPRGKKLALISKNPKGKLHWRALSGRVEWNLLNIVSKNPGFTCKQYAEVLSKRFKKPVSAHGIWNILRSHDLTIPRERTNWVEERSGRAFLELSSKSRNDFIKAVVEQGRPVTVVCREVGISRPTFYKWYSLYKSGNESLSTRRPQGDGHWRFVPGVSDLVLSLVKNHPEYSASKIAYEVAHMQSGKLSLGTHGVYNILKKHNLSKFQERLAFATPKKSLTPIQVFTDLLNRIKSIWETFTPSVAPAPPPTFKQLVKPFFTSFVTSGLFSLGLISLFGIILSAGSLSSSLGLIFATFALILGTFFLLYSFKYYITLAIVLSFSQQTTDDKQQTTRGNILSWLLGSFDKSGFGPKKVNPVGLTPDLTHIRLDRYPFISVHIPFYNEKKVVERSIQAAVNFQYEGEYEVILCDDSTDETTEIIRDYLNKSVTSVKSIIQTKGEGYTLTTAEVRPGVVVKHLHRTSRSGFKGGALELARKLSDPATEFVSIFDADFVPYPDTLTLFLKYFKASTGNNSVNQSFSNSVKESNIAAVQGYQWHVLNKSENWITRGVRSEYSGSYVIERSGTELYGGLKQISGSVYLIRKDVLDKVGWGTSITEDFELTLKLYALGYKVVYTPYIQAPSECVSTIKRLVRQRMRWSEGHSFNIRRMFLPLLRSKNLTTPEKLEFLYLSPYYLQAFFFLIGTVSWFISETLFPARLPFWTSLWGWSLVLTNMLSLPLMNSVGMFLEESEHKDYQGILSFIVLSYIVVPFQAYAAVKGFIEHSEGPWFRTPKTGHITDILSRGRFFRFIAGILPGRAPAKAMDKSKFDNSYLSLLTANSRFDDFEIHPRHIRYLGKIPVVTLIIVSLIIGRMAFNVHLAEATAGTQIKTVEFFLYQYNSGTEITTGNGIDNTAYGATCGSSDSDPSVTINIPESGVTFRSAVVEWRTVHSAANAVAASDYNIQFCDSDTTTSDTGSGTVTTSTAENNMVVVRLNATAAMATGSVTYWFDAQLTSAGAFTRNLDSMKLILTYEYDQTSTTQLKTVYFYGTQQTGTASTTDLDAVINPNLTEGSISVKDSFAILKGNVNGADNTISASYAASGTCGSQNAVAVADGSLAPAYKYFVLFDTTNTINLPTDICIRHDLSLNTVIGCQINGIGRIKQHKIAIG